MSNEFAPREDTEPTPSEVPVDRRDFLKFLAVAGTLGGAAYFGIYEAHKQADEAHYVAGLEASYDPAVEGIGGLEALDDDKHLFGGVMQYLEVLPEKASSEQAKNLEAALNNGLYSLNVVDLNGLNLSDPKIERPVVHDYFKALFGELNTNGLAAGDVGTFVLCPEFVTGFGGYSTEYVPYLNMFLSEIKEADGSAQTSNLVDLSETIVLLSKLSGVNENLLDSIGVGAIPGSDKITFGAHGKADISGYLSAGRVQEVVSALGGNKPVWLNTGIIRDDKKLGVKYSLKERMAIAESTVDVVRSLKDSGVEVSNVNLFAKNELDGQDPALNIVGRDFSFHPGDEKILTILSKRLMSLDVGLSGYAVPSDMLKVTKV